VTKMKDKCRLADVGGGKRAFWAKYPVFQAKEESRREKAPDLGECNSPPNASEADLPWCHGERNSKEPSYAISPRRKGAERGPGGIYLSKTPCRRGRKSITGQKEGLKKILQNRKRGGRARPVFLGGENQFRSGEKKSQKNRSEGDEREPVENGEEGGEEAL